MIPEFPLPDEIDLLHSRPHRGVFSVYSTTTLLPESLRCRPTLAISAVENPIDLHQPLQAAKSLALTKRTWSTPVQNSPVSAVLSSTASTLLKSLTLRRLPNVQFC